MLLRDHIRKTDEFKQCRSQTGGAVVQLVVSRTCDQEVVGSTAAISASAWTHCSQPCTPVKNQYNLVPASEWAVTLCAREGNRRSNIALAMRYRVQWFFHLRPPDGRANHAAVKRIVTTFACFLSLQTAGNCLHEHNSPSTCNN